MRFPALLVFYCIFGSWECDKVEMKYENNGCIWIYILSRRHAISILFFFTLAMNTLMLKGE